MVPPARRDATRTRTDDRALVRQCLKGDASAWERLVLRYRRLIYSVPVNMGLGPDRADEVFQRVCLKLLRHLKDLRRSGALPAWLMTTARRESLALVRSERREEPTESAVFEAAPALGPDVQERLERVEEEHALALALEALDPRCRQLLVALFLEQPPPDYQELSRRLGRPVGSLGPTRARCLQKLRKLYRSEGGPEP